MRPSGLRSPAFSRDSADHLQMQSRSLQCRCCRGLQRALLPDQSDFPAELAIEYLAGRLLPVPNLVGPRSLSKLLQQRAPDDLVE